MRDSSLGNIKDSQVNLSPINDYLEVQDLNE
jgi:hypothetical protein